MKLKILDYFAFILMAATVFSLAVPVFSSTSGERIVRIISPAGEWLFPLSKDLVFTGAGPEGVCRIVIEHDTVRVTESSCPRNICIKTGAVSKSQAWIACLPHGVFIKVEGKARDNSNDEVDAVSI